MILYIILLIIIVLLIIIIYKLYKLNKKIDKLHTTTLNLQSTGLKSSPKIQVIGMDGKPKEWVFILKTGKDTTKLNCESIKSPAGIGNPVNCKYFYADNKNPSLRVADENIVSKNGSLYYTWSQCMNPGAGYINWNDESYNIKAGGASGGDPAHDKGWIIYDNNGGVFCNHSCPAWPYHDADAIPNDDAWMSLGAHDSHHPEKGKNPGTISDLAQHFFMASMDASSIDGMAKIIETAAPNFVLAIPSEKPNNNVQLLNKLSDSVNDARDSGKNWTNSSMGLKCKVPEFSEGNPQNPPDIAQFSTYNVHLGKTPLTIYGKSGCWKQNPWSKIKELDCEDNITLYTFCIPKCFGTAGGGPAAEGVNEYTGLGKGSEFEEIGDWKKNHSKIGYCGDNIFAGGWNNASSQLKRGSIFISFNNKFLSDSLRLLIPSH